MDRTLNQEEMGWKCFVGLGYVFFVAREWVVMVWGAINRLLRTVCDRMGGILVTDEKS